MSYQVELRHLLYFSVLAEELHFRRAAERLFISQPGLTRQIKQLESIYGVLLFERGKRFVKLTQAGIFLKAETDILAAQLENMHTRLQKMGEGKMAELKIGFIGSAAQTVIPDMLYQLNKKYPDIEANLHELPNETQVEYLLEDKLDVGLVRMRSAPPGLAIKKIFEEPFALVLPRNHPAKNFRSLKQFSKEPFILFGRNYSNDYFDLVMSIFTDQGFVPRVHHKTVNALTIFKLVEKGMGIAVVPASLHRGYNVSVQFIELNKIPQRSPLALLWNPKNRNPGMKLFLEMANKMQY